jgi:hypothetical protein
LIILTTVILGSSNMRSVMMVNAPKHVGAVLM